MHTAQPELMRPVRSITVSHSTRMACGGPDVDSFRAHGSALFKMSISEVDLWSVLFTGIK